MKFSYIIINLSVILFYISTKNFAACQNWSLQIADKYISTSIPVDTYAALENNQIVNNTFYENNDLENRWIANSKSIFTYQFHSSSSLLEADRVLLIFHGIDTFATISIGNNSNNVGGNYTKLGRTLNMFIRYTYDIKTYLVSSADFYNEIKVEITPPMKMATEIYSNQSKNYIVYPKCVPTQYNGECHVNHIRKMQASFGWDWGPAVPASGIWREVEIVPIQKVYMTDFAVDVYQVDKKNWKINITSFLELASNNKHKPIDFVIQTSVICDNSVNISNKESIKIDNGIKQVVKFITMDVPETIIQRWWPNGYGKQQLYNLTITVDKQIQSRLIGFRSVELIQEPIKNGLSFYFRINDIPIFAKGSNSIPISIYPSRSSNKTYIHHLLQSAKDVNMNMLRVWGGGVYESTYFYETADKLGIMIWQDFMFACSMYPTNSEFLETVREEVEQNVWRLKSHPSIVLWAGNNENEAALYGNWYGTGQEKIYKEDYIKLYVDVIKAEVRKIDFTRPFVVSSPSNGLFADTNGWIGTDPYSNLYGDIHYYNYLADGWNINTYRRPRFASEYGFQSLPSIYSLINMTKSPANLSISSAFMYHRQHLSLGNSIMKRLISKQFRIPRSSDSLQDFTNFIYLSQVYQAQAVKVQTESYRQAKSNLNEIGEGFTMGALYWQLNDVWPAPSWSSIDIEGRWKILHNYAKDFFAPIIISPRLSITDLTIFIVSDEMINRTHCTVEMRVHTMSGRAYSKKYHNVTVYANYAYALVTENIEYLYGNTSCESDFNAVMKDCIIELVLRDIHGKQIAPANYVYRSALRDMELPSCVMETSVDRIDYSITITSSCKQLFVMLDLPSYIPGTFSENGFHILDGQKRINFLPRSDFDISEFVSTLKLVSLGQIYVSQQPKNIVEIK